MNGQKVGYIRVSSYGQNDERQLESVELDEVFREKVSAKTTKRPVLHEALKYVRKGDELHVHSIDRLARNLSDLQGLVQGLVKRGVSVHFHKEALTFTGEDSPMSKLMLQIIGAVAEFERSLIRERQREGIAQAKKAGKQFGQPAKLSPEQVQEIHALVADRHSKVEIAKKFAVSRQTIYNTLNAK